MLNYERNGTAYRPSPGSFTEQRIELSFEVFYYFWINGIVSVRERPRTVPCFACDLWNLI